MNNRVWSQWLVQTLGHGLRVHVLRTLFVPSIGLRLKAARSVVMTDARG